MICCPKSRTPPVLNSDKCSIVLSASAVSTTQHNSRPQARWAQCDNPAPLQSQWATPFTAAAASSRLNRHAGGRRRPVRRAKTRAAGPISALWKWDQDENHHQAQLYTCTQFGSNPPGGLGAGLRQTDRQTDGRTDGWPDRHSLLYVRWQLPFILYSSFCVSSIF